jgi:putative nucleotidyltransferase with HDIG domain
VLVAITRFLAAVAVEDTPSAPVVYSRRLVTYVALVALAGAGAAWGTVHSSPDTGMLVLFAASVFCMSALGLRFAIRTDTVFSATAFLHLGATLALGPVGAVATALAEVIGVAVRYRNGWFRSLFNAGSCVLSNLAAYVAYLAVRDLPLDNAVVSFALAGTVAGIAQHVVDMLMLSGVLNLATGQALRPQIRTGAITAPYHLFYGYAAVSFVVLAERWGVVGVSFALGPVVALQLSLMVMALRTRTHEAQRGQYVELLRDQRVRVEKSYDATLVALTHALDARDKETEGHSRRVVEYTRMLASQLGVDGYDLRVLCHGALLHDIGKIGVPDAILHKPGPLSDAEWQVMRRHPEIGALMIEDVEYLTDARRILLHHHERWDGRGYPLGLRGIEIPVGARVFAVADALDAMTQDRPYRRRCSLDEAREEVVRNRGTQFDPDAVAALLAVAEPELLAVAAIRSRVGVDLLTGPSARVVLPEHSAAVPRPVPSRVQRTRTMVPPVA